MKARVQKWGNSLALRIPKSLAADLGLAPSAPVDLSVVDGALIIRPAVPPAATLEELLRGVTKDNLPGEWDTGAGTGKEVW